VFCGCRFDLQQDGRPAKIFLMTTGAEMLMGSIGLMIVSLFTG